MMRIARIIAVLANAGILVALAIAGITDPPRHIEFRGFLALAVFILVLLLNIYVALARRDPVTFDETLLGLWIRTKKQKLRKELEGDDAE